MWIQKTIPQKTSFDDLKVVFCTPETHMAYLMEQKLKEEGIHVIMMNKQDSSYNNFGEIELLVNATDVVRAKYIIEKPYE